jgi:predicted GNAT family N-acyltransferase
LTASSRVGSIFSTPVTATCTSGRPELEIDGLDPQCDHAKAIDVGSRIIGTGRLLPDGHIGRLCVLPEHRGKGIGDGLLLHLIERARQRGLTEVRLNAQVSALAFYERHGFEPVSGRFMEAGIEHQGMRLQLQ